MTGGDTLKKARIDMPQKATISDSLGESASWGMSICVKNPRSHLLTSIQLLGLVLVRPYQGLEGGPQADGLPLVMLAPCGPHLLSPALGVSALRLLPHLEGLAFVHAARGAWR